MNPAHFFAREWKDYASVTSLASQVHRLLEAKGEHVENDHIALRTLAHPSMGLESMLGFFNDMGYEQGGEYFFADKRLRAIHLEAPNLPLVFVSEFLYEDDKFSNFVRETMEELIAACDGREVLELFEIRRPWRPSFATYEKLAVESEYAAWFYAWGFRTNHFTVSVNELKSINDIAGMNKFLKAHNIQLNTSGGEIKGTEVQGLVQSSTQASTFEVDFIDGKKMIPSCYYEFAKRYEINGALYRGFVPASADKIFESTNRVQR